ncbi:MAG: hypothetical protein FJ135_09445 [Deltaproteobacteria bacterium]|nr:hypothetical protein [Deltaproteobacteria bacterium]
MAIWRVHLRPDSEDVDPVDICLNQEVIGIGWRVTNKPKDRDEYWSFGEKEHGGIGWSRATNAICWRMAIDDLVWVRDFYGAYYLGRITGEWEYRDSLDNLKADIINVRPCKLYRVGTRVAGKIINCFRPSATVQQIHDETAELFSIFVFNQLAGVSLKMVPPPSIDIFSLLSDTDLEDIVGLYLQFKKGLLFVPSSRSTQNSTLSHEYELVDPKSGQPTYVQVKSGNSILDPIEYYKFPHDFYLFSPAGYSNQSTQKHIICLDRAEIETFLLSAKSFLPLNVRAWLDMIDALTKGI